MIQPSSKLNSEAIATTIEKRDIERQFSIGGSCAGHKIDGNATKQYQKQDRDNDRQLSDETIVFGVIDAIGLQHAPETVIKMYRQSYKGDNIKKTVEKSAQKLPYEHADRNSDGCGYPETENMNDQKQEDKSTGIGHGAGSKGIFDDTGLNIITG